MPPMTLGSIVAWRSRCCGPAEPAAAGLVTFCDALYVPGTGEGSPFAGDVLTVHQEPYYDQAGAVPPTDHYDPNPVSFLTVRKGVGFLLALVGPAKWTSLAMTLLEEALARDGVGGKTSSGYGRLQRDDRAMRGPNGPEVVRDAGFVPQGHGPP